MEQLLKKDPIAMGMLGKQPILEQRYRPLTYLLTAIEADKKIMYNLLTHEMIAVNLSELELSETREYLIENWYMVPEEYDDQQLVDECRAVLTLMNSWPKRNHVFLIFTTLDCNARCFYCYEKRIPGSNMTMETASRVIEYVQEQAGGEKIIIKWFGGEPLYNYPVINFISEGLREKGIQFESHMISNGLLFSNMLIEKAKNQWNMKSVQITLDGTREVYKRVKAYVTDIADPMEKILHNIKSLLKAEITVHIRLNIGLYNYKDIMNLVDFLCEEFKGEDNLYVNARPLFEVIKYSVEKRIFMYELLDELNSKLNRLLKREEKGFHETITNSSCMASGQEAVTILPDGKVGICGININDNFLGDIYTKELNLKARSDFGKRFYREDKCRPCPLYPNCYIVSRCPNIDAREGCDTIRVQLNIRRIKEKMKIRCRVSESGDGGRDT